MSSPVTDTLTESQTLDLWRVGHPSVGETIDFRFNAGRGSGGWGTGVYAFRDYRPAHDNAQRNESEVYELKSALENPYQPTTRDQSWAIHKFTVRLLKFAQRHDPMEAAQKVEDELLYDPTFEESGFAGTTTEKSLLDPARDTGMAGIWGSADDMVAAGLRATAKAKRCVDRNGQGVCSQPINRMCWEAGIDGIAPHDGAGGNEGQIGCVIFKERIEECAPGTVERGDTLSAEELNECFAGRWE